MFSHVLKLRFVVFIHNALTPQIPINLFKYKYLYDV